MSRFEQRVWSLTLHTLCDPVIIRVISAECLQPHPNPNPTHPTPFIRRPGRRIRVVRHTTPPSLMPGRASPGEASPACRVRSCASTRRRGRSSWREDSTGQAMTSCLGAHKAPPSSLAAAAAMCAARCQRADRCPLPTGCARTAIAAAAVSAAPRAAAQADVPTHWLQPRSQLALLRLSIACWLVARCRIEISVQLSVV